MTDRENFLERWSRKKTKAAREPDEQPAANTRVAEDSPPPPASPKSEPSPAVAKPAFDLSKLPSLDSITSASDVGAFLMPGVPPELPRAALRRAWTSDPAIRDFVGLSENAWDFSDPSAVPGFGDIPIGYDLKRMVAEVFGELERTAEPPAQPGEALTDAQPVQPPGESDVPVSAAAAPTREATSPAGRPPTTATSRPSGFVQCDSNAASRNSTEQEQVARPKSFRSHGRALPKV